MKEETIKRLEQENEVLRRGIDAVRALIDSSDGVTGLHLNGDVAPWCSLQDGGEYEAWLTEFNNAECYIN